MVGIEYGIMIDGKWFKEYIYYEAKKYHRRGRYGGNTGLGTRLFDGDIVDIVTTDKPERTEVGRSLGNTITTLYSIEKMRGKKIEIIPLEG